jgi:hypothetical protein
VKLTRVDAPTFTLELTASEAKTLSAALDFVTETEPKHVRISDEEMQFLVDLWTDLAE